MPLLLLILTDLVADQSADGCTANGTDRTAACKNRATNRPNACTNCRTLVTGGHPGATSQGKNQNNGHQASQTVWVDFHINSLFIKIRIKQLHTGQTTPARPPAT
jgi:hypothetical protein